MKIWPKWTPPEVKIITVAMLAVMYFGLFVWLSGCSKPADQPAQQDPYEGTTADAPKIAAPPSAPAFPSPDFRYTKKTTTTDTGHAQGASAQATGDKAAIPAIDSTAPLVNLGSGTSTSGGGVSAKLSASLTDNQRQIALIVVAALFGGIGIWRLKAGDKSGTIGAFSVAGCAVAAAMMPQWLWVCAGLAALTAGGFWLYSTLRAHGATLAVRATARAIENVKDKDTRQSIKADVADYAGTAKATVEKVVGKAKRLYRLPSEKDRQQ